MSQEAEKISNYESEAVQKNKAAMKSKFAERYQRMQDRKNDRGVAPNFNTFVTNAVEKVDLEYTGKNEVLKIRLLDHKGAEIKYGKEIHNDQEYTYEVTKLDEKDTDNIERDLKKVRWCFWIPDIKGFDSKQAKHLITIANNPESKADFLSGNDTAKMNAIKQHGILYAKKEIVEKNGKKTALLKVKFSKWLDGYKIKMEAYLSAKKGKGDTVATRLLTANPEIIAAHWLNAAGRKITYTGYQQEVYLYLKTLGLQGKTLETQVFDQDIHPNPVPRIGTDDQVEWKNNKIKIESREVIKQFKVGNKNRYKEAQQDEAVEENPFIGLYDFKNKIGYNLELYIHIANSEALDIEGVKPKYGQLNLIPEEKIITAFFAETEIEKVQADAPEVKDKKTGKSKLPPKAKVPYYKKVNDGVIGQKIQLVAECANLEGEEVVFKIYEKEPLLVEKGTALPVLQNDAEVTEIKAVVTDGYAVVDLELRQKSDDDFKKWLATLKIDGKPEDRKKTHFWVKTHVEDVEIPINKEFLKRSAFQVISTNWHEPVDDPQIAIYNQHGIKKAKSNTFGLGRGRFHSGLDIFSLEGSNVYACLDAEVFEIQKWASKDKSGYGHNITLKVKNPQELRNRKREYKKAFSTDLDKKSGFDENSKTFLLRYAHLEDILVKKGQFVKAGDIIGKSGVSGIAIGTHDPHLHFNIYSSIKAEKYLVNPAYYVYWKEINDLTEADKKIQEDRKNEKYKPNPIPKLSKLK
ncbi:M23 family metallopeptidase [Aquimarina hainanensis]|uniref:M23 family metallopeptidase n=1 Tax=Aquimarina hainanensis TaxID=1578017 RepID=A0ABW5N5C0_9FLAO